MLTSISQIKNLAVFRDFSWDESVQDLDGKPIQLAKVNIIYGRNYSGKTTLSRVVRSLETGSISDKFDSPEYTVTLNGGTTVTHASPADHSLEVRVFNEDFVREHLAVFQNEDDNIAAFAVLGEDNAEVAETLSTKEKALGSEDAPGSLRAREAQCRRERFTAQEAHRRAQDALNALLTDKARDIKNKAKYEDVLYNIRKIRPDIDTVLGDAYLPPAAAELAKHEQVLAETPKAEIAAMPEPQLQWDTIAATAKDLLARSIRPTEPMQDLLDDAVLQEWVRRGKQLHEGKRTVCGFCGNVIPTGLWQKLDKHFSQESETLRAELQKLVTALDSEITATASLLVIDVNAFYGTFDAELQALIQNVADARTKYVDSLTAVKKATEARLGAIFSPVPFPETENMVTTFTSLCEEYDSLRAKANDHTTSLGAAQTESRKALRLAEVSAYLETIQYANKLAEIEVLATELTTKTAALSVATEDVTEAVGEIAELKSRLRDERNGAEKVNQYLNHDFGHQALRLEAIPAEDGSDAQYYFKIKREGRDAYHLSEGERSLLAFCYFLARLDDTETSGKPLVVWIDDPVSNLDDNHAFFVYSLIRTHIAEDSRCQQLFVSTHNLSFLKYLYRLPPSKEKQKCYLLVERNGSTSDISAMPEYLKLYVTEFHHLFRQIHRCANADLSGPDDESLFYSFPNNVRRFLEMYLVFKYPDHGERAQDKIKRFFGQDAIAATMADRVNNEYSHGHGLFERASLPMDATLMKSIAECVLERLKTDEDQYNSLLRSIGAIDSD